MEILGKMITKLVWARDPVDKDQLLEQLNSIDGVEAHFVTPKRIITVSAPLTTWNNLEADGSLLDHPSIRTYAAPVGAFQ